MYLLAIEIFDERFFNFTDKCKTAFNDNPSVCGIIIGILVISAVVGALKKHF